MIEVRGAGVSSPATGAPSIRGILQQGETLTADTAGGIEDENGIPEDVTYSYQWVSSDGATDTDIEGATGPTYIPHQRRLRQVHKGAGELHRRRRLRGDAHQRRHRQRCCP